MSMIIAIQKNTKTLVLFRVLKNYLELKLESFGVPGRQGNPREDYAVGITRNCPNCKIYTRDQDVWGFVNKNQVGMPSNKAIMYARKQRALVR